MSWGSVVMSPEFSWEEVSYLDMTRHPLSLPLSFPSTSTTTLDKKEGEGPFGYNL